ncbi:MAG: hypothetical protein C3F07_05170 [Anaerolineales bacterium]|nr:hypothetical protein [Anaerolineae bacterium]PWB75726.1 MAG: hypothetical protein C3F07_05170 [Anaerolineales bacterium]
MSYKVMFVINAIVAVAFGLAFLVVPEMVLGQFRVDPYDATRVIGQFFGTAMIALGLVLWFAKDANDPAVQRGLGIALLVSSVLGLIVNIIGVSSGVIRANGWITIVIYVLFALGYAFMIFLQPKMKE